MPPSVGDPSCSTPNVYVYMTICRYLHEGSSTLGVMLGPPELYDILVQGAHFHLFSGTLYQIIVLALIVPAFISIYDQTAEQMEMSTIRNEHKCK